MLPELGRGVLVLLRESSCCAPSWMQGLREGYQARAGLAMQLKVLRRLMLAFWRLGRLGGEAKGEEAEAGP